MFQTLVSVPSLSLREVCEGCSCLVQSATEYSCGAGEWQRAAVVDRTESQEVSQESTEGTLIWL